MKLLFNYRKELGKQREENVNITVSVLHLKKRGRPVLLGDISLDSMVQTYIFNKYANINGISATSRFFSQKLKHPASTSTVLSIRKKERKKAYLE